MPLPTTDQLLSFALVLPECTPELATLISALKGKPDAATIKKARALFCAGGPMTIGASVIVFALAASVADSDGDTSTRDACIRWADHGLNVLALDPGRATIPRRGSGPNEATTRRGRAR